MRILVACEFSGIVREAFSRRGHDTVSVDLIETEIPGKHIIGDVIPLLDEKWDMIIAFPPCTYLANSGARWNISRRALQEQALEFVARIANSSAPKIAIENPLGILSTRWRKPDQILEPWQFGHGEKKRTCLWLKNLPLLLPTKIVAGRIPRVHYASPSADRWKERSRTYIGIAEAMADQWG